VQRFLEKRGYSWQGRQQAATAIGARGEGNR
jgi:hypothetical protein